MNTYKTSSTTTVVTSGGWRGNGAANVTPISTAPSAGKDAGPAEPDDDDDWSDVDARWWDQIDSLGNRDNQPDAGDVDQERVDFLHWNYTYQRGLYETGDATYDDVQDAFHQWQTARGLPSNAATVMMMNEDEYDEYMDFRFELNEMVREGVMDATGKEQAVTEYLEAFLKAQNEPQLELTQGDATS